jgi:hypothetical protein
MLEKRCLPCHTYLHVQHVSLFVSDGFVLFWLFLPPLPLFATVWSFLSVASAESAAKAWFGHCVIDAEV